MADDIQNKIESTVENAINAIPTPQEILQSISLPALPEKEAIIDSIVPGKMSNADLIAFLTRSIVIPGLSVDSILQLGFATQYAELLGKVDTKKERQEIAEKLYDDYVTQNKEKVQKGISQIKAKYSSAKERLETLIKRVRDSVARIANPPVIGTAAPNPTRTLQDYLEMKRLAESELSAITKDLLEVAVLADEIGWDLPEEFDVTAQLLGTAKTALDLIPI